MARHDLVDQETFRTAARAGQAATLGVTRPAGAAIRAVDDKSRTVRFCFSDGSVDRMGDTIDPAGWELGEFLKNPVALWAHDSNQPPIGRVVSCSVEGRRLLGDIAFIPPDTYDFADLIYRLVVGKWLNAVSVGFLPLAYKFSDDPDRPFGVDYQRQQLLEISIVPVPALSSALVEARAMGAVSRAEVQRFAGDDGYQRRLAQARDRRAQLDAPLVRRVHEETAADRLAQARAVRARCRGEAHSEPLDDGATRAERLARVAAIRALSGLPRQVDPRVEVAAASFRLRSY